MADGRWGIFTNPDVSNPARAYTPHRRTMATIQSYQTVNGATLFMVRYGQPNNKTTMKRRFTTKRDAKAFANKVEVDKTTYESK
jgi:hypothetical protein